MWRWPFTILDFLVGYADMFFFCWVGIWGWEASTKTPLPTSIKLGLYAGAFLGTSFWNWQREKRRADVAEAALAAKKNEGPARRVFVEDPAALLNRSEADGMLAERLLIPNLDKWIVVSGRFEGITESLVGDAIHLSLVREGGRRVHLRFPVDSRNRLGSLRPGPSVTAVCQIRHGYGLGAFTLENAELIRIEPPASALARAS